MPSWSNCTALPSPMNHGAARHGSRKRPRLPISGNPDVNLISTSYVERQNLTIRMQVRRFTRLTNAFSKKLYNLKTALALHFAHYNFVRVHSTLRVAPAVMAGLERYTWSVSDLLDA